LTLVFFYDIIIIDKMGHQNKKRKGRKINMYNAYVTKLKNVRKHPNADRLLCAECFGNGVVVGLDHVENELVLYFPADGRLSLRYSEANNLLRKKDPTTGENIGGYLDPDKRNISCLKLRGERSDGLVMPLDSLKDFTNISKLKDGDLISILNGVLICEKYIPVSQQRTFKSGTYDKKKEPKIKIRFPYFEEHKDTAQLPYNLSAFKFNDTCYITLKMHGTSGRQSYALEEKRKNSWVNRLLKRAPKIVRSWNHVTGTRRVVLEASSTSGYYKDNNFRLKYHDFFKTRLRKGETVYFEILGWVSENTPIMTIADNKKTKDKDFIKKYGDRTVFSYGCNQGENKAYVYRMTLTNEDGYVVEYPTELVSRRCEEMGINFVPIFEKFLFTTSEDLLERVEKYMDGEDPIGKTHIREGVVVRIDNSPTFKAFKHKNFNFKVLENIIKVDSVEPDIEEAQETQSV